MRALVVTGSIVGVDLYLRAMLCVDAPFPPSCQPTLFGDPLVDLVVGLWFRLFS